MSGKLYTLAMGLGIAEQIEEFTSSGVTPRAGEAWAGKLDEWLETVLPRNAVERDNDPDADEVGPTPDESYAEWTDRHRAGVQSWSFPTEELLLEYLRTVTTRQESDVMALLRLLLFEESCFGRDSEHLHQALYVRRDLAHLDSFPTEYRRRLLQWLGGAAKPHPSIRWALDLLPHSPRQAIDAITGYLNVYRWVRPSGRSEGLLHAIAVIRARWIENAESCSAALSELSPREFELLVAALFRELGYRVEVTPASRDGGRDIIASKTTPSQKETIEIECKTHSYPVGVKTTRQLQGVVAHSGSSRGVLVTTGTFTRGSIQLSLEDNRLELIDGTSLARMLNAEFGPLWIADRAWICRELGQ